MVLQAMLGSSQLKCIGELFGPEDREQTGSGFSSSGRVGDEFTSGQTEL